MSHPINRTDATTRAAQVARVSPIVAGDVRRQRQAPLQDVRAAAADTFDGLPSVPPKEVMDEVAATMDRLDDLRQQGVSLRFEQADAGPVRISVVGDDGEVRRRIPATEAIAIAAGERPALPAEPAASPAAGTVHVDLEA